MQPTAHSHSLATILALLDCSYTLQGSPHGRIVDKVRTTLQADEASLTWIDPQRADRQELLDRTLAGIVVCDDSVNLAGAGLADRVLIQVANPRLTFIKLAAKLFEVRTEPGVHATAVVHPEARLAANAHVGPQTYIGKAEIGPGAVFHGNVFIYDNVRIGANVVIHAGTVIGTPGYSLERDETGEFIGMPHLGGVVIEDDVEIQALSVVDRGTLDDTVIGRGTKINSHCYVAHNCRVGRRNFIAGHTVLAGSVTTGDDCWFGPQSVVRDRLRIGDNCFIGMGSVVVSSLGEKSRVMGNPARPIEEAKRILGQLKQLGHAAEHNK